MVRRWSYLNLVNKTPVASDTTTVLVKVFQQVTFKATTYYRKPLYNPVITKITRKNFYRRRHLNSWLVYQNIITLWAKEYLFFRKYTRTLLSLFFYKNSFLTYNYLINSKLTVDEMRNFGETQFTYFVNSIRRFCSTTSSVLVPFLTLFRTFSPLIISTNADFRIKGLLGSNTDLLYNVTPTTAFSVKESLLPVNELSYIFNLSFRQQLTYYLAMYKVFIYIVLHLLAKN